jgi:hypothetical protein
MFHHHTHTMSLTTYREVCADLLRGLDELKHPRFSFPFYITAAMCRARELLAQPTPAEPVELTDEELLQITAQAQIYRFQATAGDPVQYEPTEVQLLAAFRAAIAADRARQPTPAELAAAVDLDALLSPAGAYEIDPDIGNLPGSQLVCDQRGGNPTWWAPAYGFMSLGDLLDQIRSRILPHLRPPVVGIDIPGPDGDWGDIVDLCQAEGVEVSAGARLLRRARAAWGQASAAPAEPADHIRDGTEMVAPPAEGEVGELAAQLGADAECVEAERYDLCNMTADQMRRAATLLQQQAAELAALRQERPHV